MTRPDEWSTNYVTLTQEAMDLKEDIVALQIYFFSVVQTFQQRDLTNANDTMNAFASILQRVAQRARTKVVAGLPHDLFPVALIFLHRIVERSPRRRHGFPSWSWAGWTGDPIWYSFLRLEEDSDRASDTLGKTCAISHQMGSGKTNRLIYETLWNREQSRLESACSCISDHIQAPVDVLQQRIHRAIKPRPHTTLSVRAIAVYLKLSHVYEDSDPAMPARYNTWIVSDGAGCECGYLYLDDDHERTQGQIVKLVLLSKCHSTIDYPIQQSIWNETEVERDLFWVVFIVPMSNGIYERRGIGQILGSCVGRSLDSRPRWIDFALG